MGGAAWKRHTVRWAIQIIVLPHCVSWNSVTELSRDWLNWIWAAWKAVAHSFQDLHSQGVCVCVSMISQQSHSFQYRMEKWGGVCWQRHPSPAVGGACCCAAERGHYIKGDGWVSCSLTKLSRRLIGGAGAQTIPEDSVSTKQCHVTTEQKLRGSIFFFVHCSVWPISFLKMLKALCWTETVWEGQEERRQQRGWFRSICFLKQASFVSSRWGRQNGHVSTPPALYVL